MPTNTTQGPSLEFAAVVGGFIAAVLAAAAIGVVLAVSLLTGPATDHSAHLAAGPFGVAEDIPTSFGFVAVEHAETIKGLTAKDLAGAVHGVGSYVSRDKALVRASITLRNGVVGETKYSLGQFRLRTTTKAGKVTYYPVSHATVADGILQPDAALDGGLAFVIPRNGAELAIEFADPGRSKPIVIDLAARSGQVTAAEQRALSHPHGH